MSACHSRGRGIVALAALLAVSAILAPAARANDNMQGWGTISGDVRVADDTQLTMEVVARSRQDAVELGQLILRGGVRWQVAPDTNLGVNYTWQHTIPVNGFHTSEHRLSQSWGQRLWRHDGWGLESRLQFEQRLMEHRDGLGLRIRPRLRLSRTLAPNLEAQLSDELIVALNDTGWGQRQGLVANRLSGQLHWKISPHIGFAPGYMWQRVRVVGSADRSDHVALLTLDVHY